LQKKGVESAADGKTKYADGSIFVTEVRFKRPSSAVCEVNLANTLLDVQLLIYMTACLLIGLVNKASGTIFFMRMVQAEWKRGGIGTVEPSIVARNEAWRGLLVGSFPA
jgi:hypothetical protein